MSFTRWLVQIGSFNQQLHSYQGMGVLFVQSWSGHSNWFWSTCIYPHFHLCWDWFWVWRLAFPPWFILCWFPKDLKRSLQNNWLNHLVYWLFPFICWRKIGSLICLWVAEILMQVILQEMHLIMPHLLRLTVALLQLLI